MSEKLPPGEINLTVYDLAMSRLKIAEDLEYSTQRPYTFYDAKNQLAWLALQYQITDEGVGELAIHKSMREQFFDQRSFGLFVDHVENTIHGTKLLRTQYFVPEEGQAVYLDSTAIADLTNPLSNDKKMFNSLLPDMTRLISHSQPLPVDSSSILREVVNANLPQAK